MKANVIMLVLVGILMLWAAYALLSISWLQVQGSSMEPTLTPGSWIMVDKWYIYRKRLQTGDIVLIKSPSGELVVKRIAINELAPIIWHNDALYIPAYAQAIAVQPEIRTLLMQYEYIQKNQLFILGDNIPISYDSRAYGLISQQQIIGKVIKIGQSTKLPAHSPT